MISLPYTATGGQQFGFAGPVPPQTYNVTSTTLSSENDWLRFEVRQGDKAPSDTINDRVRLDAGMSSAYHMPAGKIAVDRTFAVQFVQNSAALINTDNLNFAEYHHVSKAGDVGAAGPIIYSIERSAGLNASVFRLYRNQVTYSANGLITAQGPATILYQLASGLPEGVKITFREEIGFGPSDGYIRVWMTIGSTAEIQIANYTGQVSYGDRRVYPQIGGYRRTRSDILVLLFKIYSGSVAARL